MPYHSHFEKGRHEIRSYSSEVVASRREEMPRIFDSVELVITVDTDASDAVLERGGINQNEVLQCFCSVGSQRESGS